MAWPPCRGPQSPDPSVHCPRDVLRAKRRVPASCRGGAQGWNEAHPVPAQPAGLVWLCLCPMPGELARRPLHCFPLLGFLPSVLFLDVCFWSSCLPRVSRRPKGSGSFGETAARRGPSFLLSPPGPPGGPHELRSQPIHFPPVSRAGSPPQADAPFACAWRPGDPGARPLPWGSSGTPRFGAPGCSSAGGAQPLAPFTTWNPGSNTPTSWVPGLGGRVYEAVRR